MKVAEIKSSDGGITEIYNDYICDDCEKEIRRKRASRIIISGLERKARKEETA